MHYIKQTKMLIGNEKLSSHNSPQVGVVFIHAKYIFTFILWTPE